MPEHLIRLRGGWQRLDPHDDGGGRPDVTETGTRLDLPWTWPGETAGPVRLVRSFGPPPFDPRRETLSLRLARVEGLRSARLNGREIARGSPGTVEFEIPLSGPLPRRNLLVLDLDPPGPGPARQDWGAIALVIRDDPSGQLLGGCVPRE
jgi:hypothetical protein